MLLSRLQQQPQAFQAHQTLLSLAPDSVLVGGAVRDLLLDEPVHDLDYVLHDNTLEVARQLANTLGGAYYPLDEARGVGRVVWRWSEDRQLIVDVARIRKGSLDDDLKARDFTLNAIAMLPTGLTYDPLSGVKDLRGHVLRLCTDDSFIQDPLRVLRAVRFLFSFHLHPATGLDEKVREAISGLRRVSPERQRDELFKIFSLPEPHFALVQMQSWGLLQPLFPDLMALQNLIQSPPHVYDVYEHSLATLRWAARIDQLLRLRVEPSGPLEITLAESLASYQEPLKAYLDQALAGERPRWLWLRWAALAHDWGKASVRSVDPDGRIRFIGHEKVSARLADAWLEHFHCAMSETFFVHAVCAGHMRPLYLNQGEQHPSRRSIYRLYRDLGDATVGVVLLSIADNLATYGPSLQFSAFQQYLAFVRGLLAPAFAEDSQMTVPKPMLNGNEIMSELELPPGPHIGELLEELREAQALGMISDREDAIAVLRSLIHEQNARGIQA